MEEKKNRVLIECETRGFEEATEEVKALVEAYEGFPPQVQIRDCRDCNITIYPSQTKIITVSADEERQRGYEDGYDDGCMDMIDDEEEEYYG